MFKPHKQAGTQAKKGLSILTHSENLISTRA
jgi:hypothetical protein